MTPLALGGHVVASWPLSSLRVVGTVVGVKSLVRGARWSPRRACCATSSTRTCGADHHVSW